MRYRSFRFFLCLLVFLTSGLSAICQRNKFTVVETGKRISILNVNSMVQDSLGFIWMAASNGLYKYDGYQYWPFLNKQFNSGNRLSDERNSMAIDRSGAIWTNVRYNGIDRLDPVTGEFTHIRHDPNNENSLGSDTAWSIVFDHTGLMWVGTHSGVDMYDPTTKKFTHFRYDPKDSNSLCFNIVRTIYEDKQGTIWIGSGDTWSPDKQRGTGGLSRFNRKTKNFTRFFHDEKNPTSLEDNRVTAIFEDSRGNFWVGTAGDGLHTMDRTTGKFRHHYYDPAHTAQPSRPAILPGGIWGSDHITFIIEDGTGKIWIGSLLNGINVWDPSACTTEHYGGTNKKTDNLNDEIFWTAFLARDNQLWLSTWDPRVYKTGGTQTGVEYIQTHVSPLSCNIGAAEDANHELWLSGTYGLMHVKNDGTTEVVRNKNPDTESSNHISLIEKDGSKFWLSTLAGIYLFDPATKVFTLTKVVDGLPTDIREPSGMLKKDSGDILWISTKVGLQKLNTVTGSVVNFQHNPSDTTSLSDNLIFNATLDSDHQLWVASNQGVNRMISSDGKFKRYLTNDLVVSVFQDHNKIIWANTLTGIYRYNRANDLFEKYADETGLPGIQLTLMTLEDSRNRLWTVSPPLGLLEMNATRDRITVLGKSAGVTPQEMTGFALLRANGSLVVPTKSGYYQFNTTLSPNGESAPAISIHDLKVNNTAVLPAENGILTKPLDQTDKIVLQHSENSFSFEFSMIEFNTDQSDARILYKLENFDNEWRTVLDTRNAYFFNVPPGNYVFHLKVINRLGQSAEKSIIIKILPPWWKTWWAILILIVTLVATVYLLYRNRLNQINRQQKAQMAIMVAAQEGERKRIARDLHDDVGTKLSALKLFLSSLQERSNHSGDAEIVSLAKSSGQFITEVMQDVRTLLLNLSPMVLEEFGYVSAVEGLIHRINETKQIHFELITYGIEERLPSDYELALFRITQELISNVLKHASAKQVNIQIGCRDEKIILMVDDDGKGFDTHATTNGFGLNNLASRTRLMNGSMVVDSQPGKGTSVFIEIPYQQSDT